MSREEEQALIDDFARGTTEHKFVTVFALSKNYVIFKRRGCRYFSGRGIQDYAPVEYTLIRKHVWCLARNRTTVGAWREWQGRVKASELLKALAEAETKGVAMNPPAPVPQPECPECEKLSACSKSSNAIGEFLDWLNGQGYVLAKYHEHSEACEVVNGFRVCGYYESELSAERIGTEVLLAQFFKIDLDKVETERRALLEWIRLQQERKV